MNYFIDVVACWFPYHMLLFKFLLFFVVYVGGLVLLFKITDYCSYQCQYKYIDDVKDAGALVFVLYLWFVPVFFGLYFS